MNFYKEGIYFFNELVAKKFQIRELTKRDFKQRYTGSFMGLLWAFIEPLAFIAILWFVFTVGFRANPDEGTPFVAYLLTGLIPFNFFNEITESSAGIVRNYSFLIQKVNFRASILPIIKLNSALILHFIFLAIICVVMVAVGLSPTIYWFQVLYYLVAMCVLVVGISWLLSAIGAFVKDIKHIVTIFLRFLFWLTPIFWQTKMLPEKYHIFLFLNPLNYIVQGYRDSFINRSPFWEHLYQGFYFWGVTGVILIAGVIVFKRLSPHFPDVL